jgi:Mg2+ and Co2+ transporter CorA
MEGHRVIKLLPGQAIAIKKRWIEIDKLEKNEDYYREAGELLKDTMEMYRQILAEANESQQLSLTEDKLTSEQLKELEEVREEILQKIKRTQIFNRFLNVLSSISLQTSNLGGRKSNKRNRSSSRSQNKRYSRRRSNVGKRRQYSSRRK